MADHPAACVHWFRFLKLRHTVSYLTGYPLGIRGSHTATPWGVADPGWAWALCGGGMITGVPGEASSLAGHLWMDLIRVGIDEEEVGKQLETEGVEWIGSPPAI